MKEFCQTYFKQKSKQGCPGSCRKIPCDEVLPVEWPENTHSFPHHRNVLFTCQFLRLSYLVSSEHYSLRFYLTTQSHHHHESLECCYLSSYIHLLICLMTEMCSSVNFLLFPSTDGKRKILNSHLGSMKAKIEWKDDVSSLRLHLLERQCNTLGNAVTLKDDAIMTITLLLYHPPRDFIILPFLLF